MNISPPTREAARFPLSVRLAGVIWLLVGLAAIGNAWQLFSSAIRTDQQDIQRASAPRQSQPKTGPTGSANPPVPTAFLYVGAVVGVLVGLAFLITGTQAVAGLISQVKGAGIASVILGVLGIGSLVAQLLQPSPDMVAVGLAAGVVVGLLAAGVLAILGAQQYRSWRKG